MLKDFLDNLLLFYERYDSHLPLALLADKRVNLVDFRISLAQFFLEPFDNSSGSRIQGMRVSTEFLPGLMGILAAAPADLRLPVVLNCHLYGTKLFYELASWITDVWLVDLRYGNDSCASALSGVENYMKYARVGLDAMAENDAKVIVRILVLPGHVSCCHEPAVEILSEHRDRIWVSILDQYVPEHEAHLDEDLKRRPTKEEISEVEALVERHALRNIASNCRDFWGS